MYSNRNRLRFGLFLMFLVGAFIALAVEPAAAAVPTWAKWKVNVSFPNNKLNTQLIVQTGHTTSTGKDVIDQTQNFPVTCLAVGNPVIQNGRATFNGSSYFQCSVPSIKDKVLQMTSGQLVIADTCGSKLPYVTGTIKISDSPVQLTTTNPLFYRDDIYFGTPLNVGTLQAKLSVSFGQVAATSGNFALTGTGQNISAVYNKNGVNFAPAFKADGVSLSATPALLTGPIVLSTLDSIVYLGYSPAAGTYFEGTLTSLVVDPYCVGTG